jgi:hypothetical protein
MKTRNRIINPIKDESEKPKIFILLVTTIYDNPKPLIPRGAR